MTMPKFLCRCWNVGAGSPSCTTPDLITRTISLAPCLHGEGAKGLLQQPTTLGSHSITGGSQGMNLEAGMKAEATEECGLLAGTPQHAQPAFLQLPGPPAQPWCHSPCAGPSHINPYQSHRKCIPDLPTGQSGGGIFTIGVSSSHMTL